MDKSRIIKVDLCTKIIYFLFNFFAPISIVAIVCSSENFLNIGASLASLMALLLGLIIAIHNLSNSNKYLVIEEKVISICKGNIKNPKIERMIEVESIEPGCIKQRLLVKSGDEYIKLLHTSCSLVSLCLFVGPLIFIPLMKNKDTEQRKLLELYQFCPELFENAPPPMSVWYTGFANFLTWCFVLFITGIGLLAVFMIPFYPFMVE